MEHLKCHDNSTRNSPSTYIEFDGLIRPTITEFDEIGWKHALLASDVGADPPAIVDHLHVGDQLARVERNLVLLRYTCKQINKG